MRLSSRRCATRIRVLLALGLSLVVLLAGCGIATDPERAVPDKWVDPPSVTEKARGVFTPPELESAYAMVTAFALERGFDPVLMDPQKTEYTADELNAGVLSRITPTLQERWKARVDSALAGNQSDQDGLRVLQFYQWEQPEWTLPREGSSLVSQWIRNGEIGVSDATEDAPQRMKVTVIHEAQLRYEEEQEPFTLQVVKRVSYWMMPNTDGKPGWLIDEYEGVFAVGEELPVEESNQTQLPTPTTTPGQLPDGRQVGADAPLSAVLDAMPFAPASADAPPANPVVRDPGGALVKNAVRSPDGPQLPVGTQAGTAARPGAGGAPPAGAAQPGGQGAAAPPPANQAPAPRPAAPEAPAPPPPAPEAPAPRPPAPEPPAPRPPATTQAPAPPPPAPPANNNPRPANPPRTQGPANPPKADPPRATQPPRQNGNNSGKTQPPGQAKKTTEPPQPGDPAPPARGNSGNTKQPPGQAKKTPKP
ncbi:hypothetical protein [Granulicoccus sp. GXG6511]|uniref:hypothetical protein n=1 Tax=Granulicoccus sp. GXG6511 TaxID=3381351 RepID=UPI003D7E209D